MSKKIILLTALILALALPVLTRAQVSPDSRLYQRPEWDGAVVTDPWLRGEIRYQHWDPADLKSANAFCGGLTFALPLPESPTELGGRFWLISLDPDGGDNETGVSDVDLWGKYQLIDDPFLLSIGALATLPTGSDRIYVPRASGEFNLEFFAGLRAYLTDIFALIGHGGFRFNSDADIKVTGEERYSTDGEVSWILGGGVIYEIQPDLNILAELNYESERYSHAHSDTELTGMLEYKAAENFSLAGGLGIGLDELAPEFELIFGLTLQF